MSMTEWAEEEVRIACERFRKEADGDEKPTAEYECSCLESALKAYKSIMEDGHSGASYGLTINILKRLLDEYPLTPIEDAPDIWEEVPATGSNCLMYQCKRLSSLFKDIDTETGEVSYHDCNRIICKNENGITYHNGFIQREIEELYPIQLPYLPSGRYVVLATDFSTTGSSGEFDTIYVISVREPNGCVRNLNWYYKETKNGFTKIDEGEYIQRYHLYLKCKAAQEKARRAKEV